ncbi:MAG: Na+/H+ antiporter NhaC family protein [Muribaculaceae bacterium]|nr:Na+/H+ antiporter NhaC family protein [Muribaculaceae bacterium]
MVPTRRGLLALSPVALFLLLYVVVSLVIGDFYKMPISVALAVSSMWAILIYRGRPLMERIDTYSRAAGNSNILYMIWVFVLAGAFSQLAREIGAVESTVNLIVTIFPAQFILPMLFFASCFISFSIGTSVGTVVALSPLATNMATVTGGETAMFIGAVLGGAFFGDNLSFISDTTIAATRSQYCDMADKFKANLWIAVPAAIVTLVFYLCHSGIGGETIEIGADMPVDPLLLLPYIVVIIAAIMGINVTIVLTAGIAVAATIGAAGGINIIDLASSMGAGIDSMGQLIIITLLASGMLGIIKAAGGINYLLGLLTRRVGGPRGAQAIIAVLTALVNLCTANNTVAIITVGSIARSIATRFGIDRRKTASLLDSTSCVVQCLIPYGAQTLLATSLAGISPAAPFPYLYYAWALAAMIALSIIFRFPRRLNQPAKSTETPLNSSF